MYYSIVHRPNNFIGHKVTKRGGIVLRTPQYGGGLGNLLRSFFKWIEPYGKRALAAGRNIFNSILGSNLAKETASTLKQEATKAGINIAQSALKGQNIQEAAKREGKKAVKNLGASVSKSLEQYRPVEKNAPTRKPKRTALQNHIGIAKKKKKFKDNLG